jgi:hypothetical protein
MVVRREKVFEWIKEVTEYFDNLYGGMKFNIEKDFAIYFQDRVVRSECFKYGVKNYIKHLKHTYGISIRSEDADKPLLILLPSKKAFKGIRLRAQRKDLVNSLENLEKNYDLYLYAEIWQDIAYVAPFPISPQYVSYFTSIGTPAAIFEIPAMLYSFYGIVNAVRKGIASTEEAKSFYDEKLKIYRAYVNTKPTGYSSVVLNLAIPAIEDAGEALKKGEVKGALKKLEEGIKELIKEWSDTNIPFLVFERENGL